MPEQPTQEQLVGHFIRNLYDIKPLVNLPEFDVLIKSIKGALDKATADPEEGLDPLTPVFAMTFLRAMERNQNETGQVLLVQTFASFLSILVRAMQLIPHEALAYAMAQSIVFADITTVNGIDAANEAFKDHAGEDFPYNIMNIWFRQIPIIMTSVYSTALDELAALSEAVGDDEDETEDEGVSVTPSA